MYQDTNEIRFDNRESENLKKMFPKYMALRMWSNETVFAKTEKGVEKLF